MIHDRAMVQVRDSVGYVVNELRHARELVVVDVLRLVRELMIVAMPTRGEEDDRNSVARILVVIAAAVVLLRMSVGVVLIVEPERRLLRLPHALHQIAELRGETMRSDQLQVTRPASRN